MPSAPCDTDVRSVTPASQLWRGGRSHRQVTFMGRGAESPHGAPAGLPLPPGLSSWEPVRMSRPQRREGRSLSLGLPWGSASGPWKKGFLSVLLPNFLQEQWRKSPGELEGCGVGTGL